MLNYVFNLLLVLGAMIALFGVAVDYLLPGTSPGLNLPQLLIIAAGLSLSFGAWQLRRPEVRRKFSGTKRTLVAKVLLIALITLLVLEFALSIWGMPTYFPSVIPGQDVIVSDFRICDELGCRPATDATRRGCADRSIVGRPCIINRQGFADKDDFVVGDDFGSRMRMMMMGDSFTQGYSADIGESYVEFLEAVFPEIIVWNTAISGNGTNRAAAAFQAFAPTLRPQLSVLGFVMNDFRDNLVPHDDWLVLEDVNGAVHFVRRFRFDRWGNPVELSADVVYAYLAKGYNPPLSELERVTGLTRLGTLLLRLLDNLGNVYTDESLENQHRLTRQYLIQLRDAASELDSTLLVLLVPRTKDIGDPGEEYLTCDPVDARTGNTLSESHRHIGSRCRLCRAAGWSLEQCRPPENSALLLAECVDAFIESGDLGECDNVVMPAQ